MEEIKQPYDKLLRFIDRIGPIDKIVKNPDVIRMIISFDTDRHLLCALFDRINEAIEAGRILPEELDYFRSGMLMDDIVHLESTIKGYGHDNMRGLYPAEILDKVNYVSLLKDEVSLSACYTHPEILDAICGKNVPHASDLKWWLTSGTFNSLPNIVQSRVVASVMEKGDYELAHKLVMEMCYNMPISKVNSETKKTNTF